MLAAQHGVKPLEPVPCVIVYGRDSCGNTTRMRHDLDRAHVSFTYKNVDEPGIEDELHLRMEASGLQTAHYYLPVVDVNAELMTHPAPDTVIEKYDQRAKK